jgi:two-component system cell cycle sensor histidine kinase/response regulator CckA
MLGRRVLVVDDASEILNLIAGWLSKDGYEVLVAQSPRLALEIVSHYILPDSPALDLIVSDVMMPEMDGRQMVDEIRKVLPGPPVLFISGCSYGTILPENAYFLPKPFTMQTLAMKVAEVLTASEANRLRTERMSENAAQCLRERRPAAEAAGSACSRKNTC